MKKLIKEDYWILYRLISDHLNSISELASELNIRDGSLHKYIDRLEKVEKKLIEII